MHKKQAMHTRGAQVYICYTIPVLTTCNGAAMLNPKIIEEISAKLNDVVANSPAKDFEKNARALLAQGFSKLDLVTREEFDIQVQILSRAREQLTALEAKVAELEAQRGTEAN